MTRNEHAPVRAPAPFGAAAFLAQQGSGALHLSLPAAALRAARVGVQRQDLRGACTAGAAERADRIRLREHRVRRPRDHARGAARAGDPETPPRDAAAGLDVRRGDARLDVDRVRTPDRGALRPRPRALRTRPRTKSAAVWS